MLKRVMSVVLLSAVMVIALMGCSKGGDKSGGKQSSATTNIRPLSLDPRITNTNAAPRSLHGVWQTDCTQEKFTSSDGRVFDSHQRVLLINLNGSYMTEKLVRYQGYGCIFNRNSTVEQIPNDEYTFYYQQTDLNKFTINYVSYNGSEYYETDENVQFYEGTEGPSTDTLYFYGTWPRYTRRLSQ